MKESITFHTNLNIKECEKRLTDEGSSRVFSDIKFKSNFPRFSICFTFASSGGYTNRPIKFYGVLKEARTGTDIVGYYRYSPLITFFWVFFFCVSSVYLFVNSGKQYPYGTVITIMVGFCIAIILRTIYKYDVNTFDKPSLIVPLKLLLEIENV